MDASTSLSVGGCRVDAGDAGRFGGVHERVALLCVDFDDTITEADTTSLLAKAVMGTKVRKPPSSEQAL